MDSAKDLGKDKKSKSQKTTGNNPYPGLQNAEQDYSMYSQQYQKQMKAQGLATLSLNEWFAKLLNHEKSIALTIVDSDVVSLIKAMHAMYHEYGHGHYQATFPDEVQRRPQESEKYSRLKNFGLLYRKPKYMGAGVMTTYGDNLALPSKYDYYGSSRDPESERLTDQQKQQMEHKKAKERERSEDCLVTNIRIIKIGNEDAITLSNYLLENTQFFLQ